MTKFKIGDKVRIVKEVNEHCSTFCIGDVHEITDIDEHSKDFTYNLQDFCWVCDEEIELVKNKKYTEAKNTTLVKYNKKIDSLEEELNDKNSKIDFLNGQIYAYEKVIGTMKEDC